MEVVFTLTAIPCIFYFQEEASRVVHMNIILVRKKKQAAAIVVVVVLLFYVHGKSWKSCTP